MRDDKVPAGLHDAVALLREEVEPNDVWRQRLLRNLSEGRLPVDETRRWSLRPAAAVAAALAFMAVGATASHLVMRQERPEQPVAAAAAAPRVRFTLTAPSATTVSIVGDFNGWNEGSLPMRRSGDGRTWEIEVPLAPGRYAYSFVVDGRLERDPRAPQAVGDDFGSPSSVVMVRGS